MTQVADKIIGLVSNLVDYPFPTICRHLVAHDLLQALRETGVHIPDHLMSAVTEARDAEALAKLRHLQAERAV